LTGVRPPARPFAPNHAHDSTLAITGGTGRYARARGTMDLQARKGGTEFAFTFHVTR
jgi:hypothetical protein